MVLFGKKDVIQMNNTCFVIMPIGDQKIGDIILTEVELRQKYDYIIKNAISIADPDLDIIRADEELNPGSISNDIFTKLMHSKYVIADITYPNPNVFYELGIRHAISPRTILIREKVEFTTPFDISHLRHIEYTQAPSGMEMLAKQLKKQFEYYEKNPNKPDNQFLELCSFTNYQPISYAESNFEDDAAEYLIKAIFCDPTLLKAFISDDISEAEQQHLIFTELAKNPELSAKLLSKALKSK